MFRMSNWCSQRQWTTLYYCGTFQLHKRCSQISLYQSGTCLSRRRCNLFLRHALQRSFHRLRSCCIYPHRTIHSCLERLHFGIGLGGTRHMHLRPRLQRICPCRNQDKYLCCCACSLSSHRLLGTSRWGSFCTTLGRAWRRCWRFQSTCQGEGGKRVRG